MGSVLEASWIHRIQVIFNEFRIRNYDSINSSINFITNYRSISGGTGSGFASLLLQQLSADYPKTITLDFVIIRPPIYPQSSWNRTTHYSPPMLRWITWIAPSSSTTKPCTTFVPGIERNSRKKYLSLINLSSCYHFIVPQTAIWT